MKSSILIKVCLLICTLFLSDSFVKAQTTVIMVTEYGDIELLLYEKTPLHRDNFIKLVKEGFYDGTLFHRVIKGFMIQGGDPDSKNAQPGVGLGMGGPGYTIPAEFVPEYFHKRGALAAARMGDMVNPEKASSGSQFYIVQGRTFTDEDLDRLGIEDEKRREIYKTIGGTPHLDGGYTVFGEVTKGLEVIDKITMLEINALNRPTTDVVIKNVKMK